MRNGVTVLESIELMITLVRARLEYTLEPVSDLAENLSKNKELKNLPFLQECAALCREGADFPLAWSKSVSHLSRLTFSRQVSEYLDGFGKALGSTDVSGQLSCCDMYLALFSACRKEQIKKQEKAAKLYPPLGFLGGIAALIFLI